MHITLWTGTGLKLPEDEEREDRWRDGAWEDWEKEKDGELVRE